MGQLFLRAAGAMALAAVMTGAAAAAAALTPQQLRADLQLARRALEESHGGIYRYASKAEIDRAFDAAAARLDKPLHARALQRVLAPAVAALRCGHTMVLPSPALEAEMEQTSLLPLDVKLIDGRLYILRDFDGAGKLAGHEIVSVNGVAVAAIVARLMAAAPGDGFIGTGRAQRVARTFREGLFIHFGMQGQFTLRLRGPGPTRVTMPGQNMRALKLASATRYPQDQRSKRFLELSLLDEGKIARLRVFNFSDEEEDHEGAVVLRKAFEKVAASGAQTLLLDLRDNGGGQDALGRHLYSYLVEAPFRYYDELTVTRPGISYAEHVEGPAGIPASRLTRRADGLYAMPGHPNLGIHQPGFPTFKGKVIALINGRSFSTTAELITQLHDKKRATFIGEESGGAYHGNNSGSEVLLKLPNSGLRVVIPLVTYKLAVDKGHPNGRGVVPDVTVAPAITDYLRGNDIAQEQALRMARIK